MNLQLFLRAIITVLFQSHITYDKKSSFKGDKMSYDNQFFFVPRIICKDGFAVSCQIHNSSFCSTENGYRKFGYSFQSVEFGFPNVNDKDLAKFSEEYGYPTYDFAQGDAEETIELPFDEETFDCTNTVGSIPIDDIQKILDNHGGIDWEATLSVDACKKLIEQE
jgi:hypothetical protein